MREIDFDITSQNIRTAIVELKFPKMIRILFR
jgi:hypothetical protein